MNLLYRLLENKFIYNLNQQLMAPGVVGNIRKRLRPALDVDGGAPIRALELGCGTGHFSLHQPNVDYTGTDVNDDYFPKPPAGSRVAYQTMDATHLNFPDASFDLVYSCGLYHHLTDDQTRSSLRESVRVLKPGGRLVVTDGIYPTCGLNFPAWLIRRLDRGSFMRTRDGMLELVRSENLNVTSAETFYFTVTALEAILIRIRK